MLALAAGLIEASGQMGADVKALVGLDDTRFHAPVPRGALSVTVTVIDRGVSVVGGQSESASR